MTTGATVGSEQAAAFEKHFSAKELGDLWGLDESTVRRIFADEPGVLKIGGSGRRNGKRDYVSLRIPASIAACVHERMSRSPWRRTT